jgi:Manganese containing catalase
VILAQRLGQVALAHVNAGETAGRALAERVAGHCGQAGGECGVEAPGGLVLVPASRAARLLKQGDAHLIADYGAAGQMTVTMQYLFQGWNCRMPGKSKDLIMDVATEEIGRRPRG